MAAYYTFEDYSGAKAQTTSDNPYDGLIEACNGDPSRIQTIYQTHRTNRNVQQALKLSASDFHGVIIDEILAKLENPSVDSGFTDWRNCLVFWARPPSKVQALVSRIQEELLKIMPNLWTIPAANLHMTALEITHSLSTPEIEALVQKMLPNISGIIDHTVSHRARLVKPVVSFDAQALALSYLPAAGEEGRSLKEDKYSYHHLRRDLFDKAQKTGVTVASRYVVPSAHLTIARFVTRSDHETAEGRVDAVKVKAMLAAIDEINRWLEAEYWPDEKGIKAGGEWIVGEERGIDFRKGTLWYGGGETIKSGSAFESIQYTPLV